MVEGIGERRVKFFESSCPRDIIPLLKWTNLTDGPRHYWVVDVTSTQCISLELLGGGDFPLPLSRWHKDSFWTEGTPGSNSRILLTDSTIGTCSSSTTQDNVLAKDRLS